MKSRNGVVHLYLWCTHRAAGCRRILVNPPAHDGREAGRGSMRLFGVVRDALPWENAGPNAVDARSRPFCEAAGGLRDGLPEFGVGAVRSVKARSARFVCTRCHADLASAV